MFIYSSVSNFKSNIFLHTRAFIVCEMRKNSLHIFIRKKRTTSKWGFTSAVYLYKGRENEFLVKLHSFITDARTQHIYTQRALRVFASSLFFPARATSLYAVHIHTRAFYRNKPTYIFMQHFIRDAGRNAKKKDEKKGGRTKKTAATHKPNERVDQSRAIYSCCCIIRMTIMRPLFLSNWTSLLLSTKKKRERTRLCVYAEESNYARIEFFSCAFEREKRRTWK